MFEQDYIMRLIREMIRTILKLCFNIDTEAPDADLLESEEEQKLLSDLLDKVDQGNINAAENDLFELASGKDARKLKLALLFYSCLNEKDDAFLEEHHFSREEIQQGIRDLVNLYDITGITDPFLSD